MPTVIYHANCPDGFLAAFTCWLEFRDEATYIPANYNQKEPLNIPDNDRVYIVDFSLPKDQLIDLRLRSEKVVVLDHHKTAQENLETLIGKYENLKIRFDMTKCGAVLTWEHLFPSTPMPVIYSYVQDRDLWKWELYESREVSAALSIEPKDFSHYFNIYKTDIRYFINTGQTVLKVYQQQVSRLIKGAFPADLSGYRIQAVNSPILQSEVCEKLIEVYPEIPFSACFSIKDGKEIWSLRSKGDFDVSKVAQSFGGGGHRNAAGFTKQFDYFG